MRIDVLLNQRNLLGESPVWDVATERLYWVDSFGQTVFRATAKGTGCVSWQVPKKVGSLALMKGGGAILALEDGFHRLDFESGQTESLVKIERAGEHVRLNDGKVDRDGRFIAGSMDISERTPDGVLYALEKDMRLSVLDVGLVVSNGPCWSPCGTLLYVSDSGTGHIWAYDYDRSDGSVHGKRKFASFPYQTGLPDGATVDEDGFMWSARVFGQQICRFAPDGSIDRVIKVPVAGVTSVAFGGSDMDVLFVTSMQPPVA
ncbi:MAG TPA: SMP-30/gluconolactonase/LRE family protein, partial [Paraburkholderia sp.]